MTLTWHKETTPRWDRDKARIVGGEAAGTFDVRYADLKDGALVPGTWWRVEDDGRVVGYGWLDVVWGDAEILLATDPEARGRGVGTFTLGELEKEARVLGLRRLYNIVRPTHPSGEAVTGFLVKRGFVASEDGSLFKAV